MDRSCSPLHARSMRRRSTFPRSTQDDGGRKVWIVARLRWLLASVVLLSAVSPVGAGPLHRHLIPNTPVVAPPPSIMPPPGGPPPRVYGFPTPGYRAGWANTHYWPWKTYHYGFYGDYWQWGYFPGY